MSSLSQTPLSVRFPSGQEVELSQDEEWCEFGVGNGVRRIRFHDYGEIYAIPGLYEHLFYERLECTSPTVVSDLLVEQVEAAGEDPRELHVLDLGAGNGMVGEVLKARGVGGVVGVDIVPEAGTAVERDRPDVYAAYHVCDLLDPSPEVRAELEDADFNAMTSVAALGFGDVPPAVFQRAFDLVGDGGWIAFTIKEDFLDGQDESGFSALVREMLADGRLEEKAKRRYQHRLDIRGNPLHYVAMTGVKRG